MKNPPPNIQTKSAFSAVEMIVTVGIMVVLASLLFPALNAASRKAKSVTCLSNLRQISAGFQSYTQENTNFLPGQGLNFQERWFQVLLPYVGLKPVADGGNAYGEALFYCPLVPPAVYGRNSTLGGQGCYGMSYAVAADNTTKGANVLSVNNRSRKVLVGEKSYLSYKGKPAGADGPALDQTGPYPQKPKGAAANHRSDGNPANGPDGISNYLFIDGHVESLAQWPGADAFDLSK